MDPATIPKAYSSILKLFLNNKKRPCISPIYQFHQFHHYNNYTNDFKQKDDTFDNFSAKQWTIVSSTSKLPTGSLKKKTNNCLSNICFTKDDTAKIMKNLDPNKARRQDMIIIRMVKICGESILKPLELVSKSRSRVENFPSNGKKLMFFQFIKNNRELKESYRRFRCCLFLARH